MKAYLTLPICDAEILRTAQISDDPKIMQLERLAPEIRAQIIAARLEGFHPISVRWSTGEFAIMFCEPGTDIPSAENVIKAFHGCRKTLLTFPMGVVR
jgi:hypothetical protein